jgi:tripartite-type tricarboxylate transporter receptor subunit TctC
MKRLLHCFASVGVALAMAGVAGSAQAQAPAESWPSKPVRIVVPYVPGGSTDALTRRMAQQLTVNLGQQFIVDNKPGASGMVGAEYVSRSAPDGYTLLLGNNATHGLNQLLTKRKLVDPLTDFTPLTVAAMMPLALAVHPSVPANNAAELIAWAKANPGKAAYGTAGLGSPHHIAGEMLNQAAGGRGAFVHVPYKGSGQSISDLLGGQIPIVFAALASVLPYAQDGKVKILGLAESERQKSAPSIPTIGESVPGYAMPRTWLGYFGPPDMAPALAARINAEMVKALNEPEVAAFINTSGLQVLTSTREEFAHAIRDDIARLSKFVKTTNISMD